MTTNKLATITSNALMPSQGEWSLMHDMAKQLLPTGFLPNTIRTPEQAVAVMLKGRELQIPPMQALANIAIISGKPTVQSELMLALVHRDHGTSAMWIEESTNESCTVGYLVGTKEKFYTFTIQDAERAGLFKNQVWKSYPAAMLRARTISATARMAFPGSIGGMYVPGELGDPVSVNEDGEVISASISNQSPESTQDRPQRTQPQNRTASTQQHPASSQGQPQRVTATIVDEPDDWNTASARFHAVLNESNIDDNGKRAWLRYKGFESTKDVPSSTLRAWATQINERPEQARAFIEEQIAEQDTDTDDLTPDEDDVPTPEGLQQQEEQF